MYLIETNQFLKICNKVLSFKSLDGSFRSFILMFWNLELLRLMCSFTYNAACREIYR